MKKWIALLLAAILCLSLVACGGKNDASESNDAPANIVVDGKGTSVKEFLIEHLSEYIQSDAYLQREKDFEDIFREARDFTVTRVIEVSADGLGANNLSVHFLAVKADCDWAVDGNGYSDILLVADYNSGNVYDGFMADDSWQNDDGSMEQQIWYMLHGPLVGSGYEGGTIITDSETRTELSASDIAEINQALSK